MSATVGKINAITDAAGFLRIISRESRHHLHALKEHGAYNVAAHRALLKLGKAATMALYHLMQELSMENAAGAVAAGADLPSEIEDDEAEPEVVSGEIVEERMALHVDAEPCRLCSVVECNGIEGGCFCTCHDTGNLFPGG